MYNFITQNMKEKSVAYYIEITGSDETNDRIINWFKFVLFIFKSYTPQELCKLLYIKILFQNSIS